MVKLGKAFSFLIIFALLILLAPAVILLPGENVAQGNSGTEENTTEIEATFCFTEDALGGWHGFTAGSKHINEIYGLGLTQFTRENVVRSVEDGVLPGCAFRNYTEGSGNVVGGLNGKMTLAWITWNFSQPYPYTPKYNETFTATNFGFMAGRGHFNETDPDNNFTFVFVADFDCDADMNVATGKGFMLSVNQNGTFGNATSVKPEDMHRIIGDFEINKTADAYTGSFHLRNYPPNEVYNLSITDPPLNVTGAVLQEPTDNIHAPLDLLSFTTDGPQPTHTDVVTGFEDIAWGKDPTKTVNAGRLGINGEMDISRNTALYLYLDTLHEPGYTWIHIQGTSTCNLYINETNEGLRFNDGSPYGELWELLLLDIPYQMKKMTPPPYQYFEQYGYTFTPFGMLHDATECYAGIESFANAHISIQATAGTALQHSTDLTYGLYAHPKVEDVTPDSGYPGETLDVTIKGKYFLRADDFAPATGSVGFGPNITVNSYSIKNSSPIDNEITASISIKPAASPGAEKVNVTSCFGYSGTSGTAPYKSGLGNFTVKAFERATLQGNVTFADKASSPCGTWVDPFVVTVFDNATPGIEVWNATTFTSNTGYFLISNLTPGKYDIAIKSGGCLSMLETGVTLTDSETEEVNFGPTLAGDADNDDWVLIMDRRLLYNGWLSQEGDAKYDINCDFDRDGWLLIMDRRIMYNNWLQSGDLVGYLP